MCCLTRPGRVLPAAIRVQALDVVQMSVVVRMVSMDVCFSLYFDQTRESKWESSITANICKFKMHRTILLVVNSQEFVSMLIKCNNLSKRYWLCTEEGCAWLAYGQLQLYLVQFTTDTLYLACLDYRLASQFRFHAGCNLTRFRVSFIQVWRLVDTSAHDNNINWWASNVF